MKLKEKLSYVKGVLHASSLDKNETVLYSSLVELLEDVINEMENLDKDISIICEELDAIDEDLDLIEDELDLSYNEEDNNCCDDEFCSHDDNEIYDVICPKCKENICIDNSILDMGSIECPSCGENLEFDFDLNDMEDDNIDA